MKKIVSWLLYFIYTLQLHNKSRKKTKLWLQQDVRTVRCRKRIQRINNNNKYVLHIFVKSWFMSLRRQMHPYAFCCTSMFFCSNCLCLDFAQHGRHNIFCAYFLREICVWTYLLQLVIGMYKNDDIQSFRCDRTTTTTTKTYELVVWRQNATENTGKQVCRYRSIIYIHRRRA